jgi:maltooligosyltrehalose trehalohydrolase
MTDGFQRRFAVGAELVPAGGVHFRVWAPERKRVEVVFEPDGGGLALAPARDGYWEGLATRARPGARYRYRLDGGEPLVPDPASRFQPDGPRGPSVVIDPHFPWSDGAWRGRPLAGQVIYELHVGTFSPEGTFRGAAARLPHLRDLGVTTVELMPVVEFPGAFGWGYDGVDPFAPYHGYGRPEDLRRFVDEAHRLGLGVILDVVYNHLGPDGSPLPAFSRHYLSAEATEWGRGLNFDGEQSAAVRELVTTNAAYWIAEFHLDGLRLDATHAIRDRSREHVVAAIARAARAAAPGRSVLVIAEDATPDARLVEAPERGGHGLDAVWNDDFHHATVVALTGRREGYYGDFLGRPQELVSLVARGPLYQGQWSPWARKRRGGRRGAIPPAAFVACLENHDQVANSASGERLWRLAGARRHRAMVVFFLLGPWTPLLFQGEEWAA